VFGPSAGQVEDVADKLRYRVRAQSDGGEELRCIRGDNAAEQGFLVAEVGVKPLLAGVGGLGDPVDPGTGQTILGELGARGAEDRVTQLAGSSHSKIISHTN
jgi:hypothetical protein